jgi:hypothetical protein
MQDQPTFKTICAKDDVILKFRRQEPGSMRKNTFIIDFVIINARVSLVNFCSYNIFKLMFELNREDAIQELRLTEPTDDNRAQMLLVFKRKGDDVGIKQKYMRLNLSMSTLPIPSGGTNYVFEGGPTGNNNHHNECGGELNYNAPGSEEVNDVDAVLCMSLTTDHHIRVQFMLSVPAPAQQQPSYIENSLGVVMKKILSRTKTFIERISQSDSL